MTEHDDQLRDALRAEAEGVEARPELLDRINAEASTPPAARPPRRARIVAIAAAFALGAATVAVLAQGGDDSQRVDISDGPAGTVDGQPDGVCVGADLLLHPWNNGTETEWAALVEALERDPRVAQVAHLRQDDAIDFYERTTPMTADRSVAFVAGLILVDLRDPADVEAVTNEFGARPDVQAIEPGCTNEPLPQRAAEQPTTLALVREDGMLMTVDLTTGEQRELFALGDPSDELEEGIQPQYIDDVELSPDGQWIYYTTCCEPAVGLVHRVAIDDPSPAHNANDNTWFGLHPRVSPDGEQVAVVTGTTLIVSTSEGAEVTRHEMSTSGFVRQVSWAPGGNRIAVTIQDPNTEGPATVELYELHEGELRALPEVQPTSTTGHVGWQDTPGTDQDGLLPELGAPDDRSLRQDSSYEHELWVDAGGTVGTSSLDEVRRVPIPGLPKAFAADW